MTKMERNELQRTANQFTDLLATRNDYFNKLQDLSREAGMPVYCSAILNARQINTDRAWELYTGWCEMEGAIQQHQEWMRTLSEVNFWKNKK